jgi:hypothetical protein
MLPYIILAAVIIFVVWRLFSGGGQGYKLGANTIVRCRSGHLFTTIWVPGVSLKSIRLGWMRLQFCPVGRHWTIVTPVKDADLTDEDRRVAGQNRDTRIP